MSVPPPRRMPAPWSVQEIAGGYVVVDAAGRRLAYVYSDPDQRGANTETLTPDEARRVANNIANLPERIPERKGSTPPIQEKNRMGVPSLAHALRELREHLMQAITVIDGDPNWSLLGLEGVLQTVENSEKRLRLNPELEARPRLPSPFRKP